MSDAEALFRWYLAFTVISIALMPAVAWLGAGLGPARFALLRPLSLAFVTAIVWWPAIVIHLPIERTTVVIAIAAAGAVGWALWLRARLPGFDWRALLAFEGLWLLTFAGYALFRSFNPDIAYTEKPMEIALLSSISRSTSAPAPDPWLSGLSINYYYFGYQSMATLNKLGGIPPVIGFNLALASLFASCATIAAGIGLAVARMFSARRLQAVAAAVLAPVFLLISGNLETVRRLIANFDETVHAGWWDGVGWQASRIIVDVGVHGSPDPRPTINEFPAFSFVLGDLHPHVLTYPLLSCVLALSIGIVARDNGRSSLRLAAIGGLLGLLYASNSWDAPAGLLFVLGAIAIAYDGAWRTMIEPVIAVGAGALVVVLPFLLTFQSPVGASDSDLPGWLASAPVVGTVLKTFGVVTWRPSSARELLTVHGAWLAVCVIWQILTLHRDRRTRIALARHRDALLIVASVTLGAAVIWMPALVLLGWPLAAALWIASGQRRTYDRLIGGLFAVGLLLLLIPEFLYIQDVFSDRMNTVFKLYFQGWLVLSVASAIALVRIWTRSTLTARWVSAALAVVVVCATLPYAPLSSWDWTSGFATIRGLDGSAYLQTASPEDADIIDWVRAHAAPTDAIVEAPGCSYGVLNGVPLSRVSAFTGVPTLIGWQGHEYQWRRGDDAGTALLDERVDQANAILNGEATGLDRTQEPRFLIWGDQERTANPGCTLSVARDALTLATVQAAGWVEAYRSGDTLILVREDDPLAAGPDDIVSNMMGMR